MALTDVTGVADSTQSELENSGIETIEDLAEADPDTVLDAVSWFGEDEATTAVEEAQEIIPLSNSEEDDVEEEEDTVDETGSDTVATEMTVSYEMENNVYYHVLSAVLDEAIRLHRRTDISSRNTAFGVVDQLREGDVSVTNDGPVTVEMDLVMDELNILHQALGAKSGEYNGLTGITGLYGDLNSLRDSVNEDRDMLRAE